MTGLESYKVSALDALSANVAILDEMGTIIAINQTWRLFADANCLLGPNVCEGTNYLVVCETAIGEEAEQAAAFAAGIRAVLRREQEEFILDYVCNSPSKRSWFIGRVTRFIEDDAVRIVVSHENITPLKQAQDRIGRLQAVSIALSQALTPTQVADVIISEGAATMGAVTGTIVVLNNDQTILEIVAATDYSQTELSALNEWRTFPVDAPVPLAEAARTGKPIWLKSPECWVARYPHLAGELNTIDHKAWAMVPLVSEGRVLGTMGLAFDKPFAFSQDDQTFILTLAQQCTQAIHRSLLYEAERKARADAEAAVQIRDAFLSIAAHELKTPLTSMLGNVQLVQRRLRRNLHDVEQQWEMLEKVANQTKRLSEMIESLLDVSRLEQGQLSLVREPFDLGVLIKHITEEIRPSAPQHTIKYIASKEPLIVAGDRLRLEQVFQNLLQNAIKYSPDGGSIIVRLEPGDGECCISVSDSGIGIPKDAIPNLSKRFYRASNAVGDKIGGVGLGLYVVKEIVSLHGGTINVESVEGQGSTFTVCIPYK